MAQSTKHNVGELRPSQLISPFGVGSLVDLPHISAIVMGLDSWPIGNGYAAEISEERLLAAVRAVVGHQVARLMAPPVAPEAGPFESESFIGVPMGSFPRWMHCPRCQVLAPVESGLFRLKPDFYHPDRTRYVHENCDWLAKSTSNAPPPVVPARFLVACDKGHLDDFPWKEFAHRGPTDCHGVLSLIEMEATGEARDLVVICRTCDARRPLSDAFGQRGKESMPYCRGRRPHLSDFDPEPCGEKVKAILLGASNLWFPDSLTALAVPVASDHGLEEHVEEHWAQLQHALSIETLQAFRNAGMLSAFGGFSTDAIWQAVDLHRNRRQAVFASSDPTDLKTPEWRLFSNPANAPVGQDLRLRDAGVPSGYEGTIERVVLVEQLREVRALVGFTRVEPPGEVSAGGAPQPSRRMTLTRGDMRWVPAAEVRGEGIFIQIKEEALVAWAGTDSVRQLEGTFFASHCGWRKARGIEPEEVGFPGIRYVMLHSLAHALMRRFVLECGYSAASLKERIYARGPEAAEMNAEPMAGILIYTAASDSEGTLGGLVNLGEPEALRVHVGAALNDALRCASDPICAERTPHAEGRTLHAAACHACLFSPETACESGNRYLDRSVLVPTIERDDLAFFDTDS